MLRRLATFSHRRRRLMVFGIWIPVVVIAAVLSGAVGNSFRTEFTLPDSDSNVATALLESASRSEAGINSQIVVKTPGTIDDPAVKKAFTEALAKVAAIDITEISVTGPYELPTQVNRDRTIAFAQISIPRSDRNTWIPVADAIREAGAPLVATGAEVAYGGAIFQEFELPESEALGLLAAVIILVVAFGSVIAMGLPIGTALLGLLIGSSFVTLVSNIMSMPNEATSMVAMIGLGVGIDYALFIVTRFREALHDGMSVEDSVAEAIDTSGRAVVFAGITVIVAVLGLISVGLPFVTGFAVAMAIGVAVMIVAAVTLLPALLSMIGTRIDNTSWAAVISLTVAVTGAMVAIFVHSLPVALAGVVVAVALQVARPFVPALRAPLTHREQNNHQHTVWWKWSRVVQRRPWTSLGVAVVLLGLLSVPMLSLRLGFGDDGNQPKGTDVRKAYDLISEGFGPGFNGPLYVAITGDAVGNKEALRRFVATVGATDGVAAAAPVPVPSKDVSLVIVYPKTSPQDEATSDLVHTLRSEVIPGTGVDAKIGGFTAGGIDFSDYLGQRLPWLIGIVLVLSFVLLMAVFRSVLVPLKAVLMNLLSVGSAYGVIVAVFQWGWLADLFGVGKAGPIEPWAPMFLFAIVFGLSMDYEVFLLSRMKEEYHRTGDNFTAVADGVAATARVITAAALIMVCVFAAFVLAPDRQLKLFGMGMAVAVFVDATVVRMILVPATMELLGDRNWWIPKWLDRVLPRIDVEGKHHAHVIS
ncbi:MAG: MMPL family transporter [Acidimicrobiales bacterium]